MSLKQKIAAVTTAGATAIALVVIAQYNERLAKNAVKPAVP
ncbi:hypothetical protein [Proteus mirabilis]|nr:hypothetical protein [Proteus mirabilis]